MIKTILYISLLGLGSGQSLKPCDDSCYEKPIPAPNSGLENIIGLAIRPSKIKIEPNTYVSNFGTDINKKKIGDVRSGYSGSNFVPKYNSRNCNTNLTNFGAVRSARYTPSKSISKFDNRISSKKGFQRDRRIDVNGRV